MIRGKKVVVVMPAYNAGKTLEKTHAEIVDQGIVDHVIVVDDRSQDNTVEVARNLPAVQLHEHRANGGYGANQKTCYALALDQGADIVIMVHPDYQYTPKLIVAMASIIANRLYPCVLGSRILGGYAVREGMPRWRYVANRALTLMANLLLGAKLSEYHTGYRAFSREILEQLPLGENSDGFLFDNQMLLEVLWFGHTIGEITCPTRYSADSSSIGLLRSVAYGLGCVATALEYRLARAGLIRSPRFPKSRPRPSRVGGLVGDRDQAAGAAEHP